MGVERDDVGLNQDNRDTDGSVVSIHNAQLPLEEFISKYLCRSEPFPANETEKKLQMALKVLSILVGGTVGYSWMAAARSGAGDNEFFRIANPVCMLVSYGSTSSWAICELIDYLKSRPPEVLIIMGDRKKKSSYLEHVFCHVFGLLSTLPIAYVTYMYNQQVFITVVDTLVQYALSTLGLYQLNRYVIQPTLECHPTNAMQPTQNNLASALENVIPHYRRELLPNFSEVYAFIRFMGLNDQMPSYVDSIEGDNQFFVDKLRYDLNHRKQYESEVITPDKFFGGWLKKVFCHSITAGISLSNSIVMSVITHNALLDILPLNPYTSALHWMMLLLVNVPMFGLAIYSQELLTSTVFDVIFNLINTRQLVSKAQLQVCFGLFLISLCSGYTSYYVSLTQIKETILKDQAQFFAATMWAGETFLETVGLITIVNAIFFYVLANLENIPLLRCSTVFSQFMQSPILSAKNRLNSMQQVERLALLSEVVNDVGPDAIQPYAQKYTVNERLAANDPYVISNHSLFGTRWVSNTPSANQANENDTVRLNNR